METTPHGSWQPPGATPNALRSRPNAPALLAMVLVIATAGLVYELAIAAVASEALGDSIRQFSLVIGVYLSALGLGAYLSRFVTRRLHLTFVDVELSTALVGGAAAPGLLLAQAFVGPFELVLYATVIAVGALVGLELPLLIRILEREYDFKELIARALSVDYVGALVGSLGFALVLVPYVGLARSTVVCGLLNGLVGLLSTWFLPTHAETGHRGLLLARLRAVAVCALLLLLLAFAGTLRELADLRSYPGHVVFNAQSHYQRLVVVEQGRHFQLYLNGNLQFSSEDEHRYHEALVHPAMAASKRRKRVFVGGGGDGLAVREVLKWADVEQVTLVDLDPEMTRLATEHPLFTALNGASLRDPRVRVVNADAFVWLGQTKERFDVMLLDFPDPTSFAVGKLFSTKLYGEAGRALADDGVMAVQSTSPLFSRRAYWCVVRTIERAGFAVRPYSAFVPAFGEWGFTLAARTRPEPRALPPSLKLRYLDDRVLASAFELAPDMRAVDVEPNRLDDQVLVSYYLGAIHRWE